MLPAPCRLYVPVEEESYDGGFSPRLSDWRSDATPSGERHQGASLEREDNHQRAASLLGGRFSGICHSREAEKQQSGSAHNSERLQQRLACEICHWWSPLHFDLGPGFPWCGMSPHFHVSWCWLRVAKYAGLGELREAYPRVPITALTATANQTTIKDIIHQLKLNNPVKLTQSFNRTNLSYTVLEKKTNYRAELIKFIKSFRNQCGIVYCNSKQGCEKLAEKLRAEGILANHYHAGMEAEERQLAYQSWIDGRVNVVCATVSLINVEVFPGWPSCKIAFGMGIDKADGRCILCATGPRNSHSL